MKEIFNIQVVHSIPVAVRSVLVPMLGYVEVLGYIEVPSVH